MNVLIGIALFITGMTFGTLVFILLLCLCVAASDRDNTDKPQSKEDWRGLD